LLVGDPEELAAHAEVRDEQVAAVQLEEEVLPLPLDAGDLRAGDARRELLARAVTPDRAVVGDVYLLHPLPDDIPFQLPPDGLHFGQFRHPHAPWPARRRRPARPTRRPPPRRPP